MYWIKILTWQKLNEKDRNIRYEYRRQFLLTGAVYKMKQNQNTYAVIDTDHFVTTLDFILHSWLFHSSLKKSGRCQEVILANGDTFQRPLPLWRGLNNGKCMDCQQGQNEIAVVERWQLVGVRMYKSCIVEVLDSATCQ